MNTPRSEYAMVEELRDLIEGLVRERQELRRAGAGHHRLEANRVELVHAQWALARALTERYGGREAA